MSILEDRLATFASLHLESGGHASFDDGVCAMEAAAWIAGEQHSASPKCVSPVITAFLVNWNDSLPTDEERDRLLKPLIPLTIGTRTTKRDEETRAWMCTDWLAREQAPAWLRLAGLTEHAEALEALAPLKSDVSAVRAQPALSAAHSAAYSAAYSAALSAAHSAAYSAAYSTLAPTVEILQTSAGLLVTRMCEVGR